MDPENKEMTPEEQLAAVKAENAKIAASVADLAAKVEAVLAKMAEGEEESEEPAPVADNEEAPKEEGEKEPASEEKTDSVEALVEVIDQARLILGSKFDHKGKNVAQIQREVVESKTKTKLDAKKSADYVSARFDALVEVAQKADAANKKTGSIQNPAKNPSEKMDAAQSAREKMLVANRDAWKVNK